MGSIMSRAVAIGLLKNGTVLMTRRASNAEWAPDMWHFPGGKVESDEAVQDAAVREIAEEIGVQINANSLRFLGAARYRDDKRDMDIFFFATSEWTGAIENREPEKCQAIEWFNLDNLPNSMPEHVGIIMQNMNEPHFIEVENDHVVYVGKEQHES